LLTTAMTRSADDPGPTSVSDAIQFIRQSADSLIGILDGPAEPDMKRRQLAELLSDTIDVEGVARFALGRFWSLASDAQRDEYLRLFPVVLIDNLGKALSDYQGMRFSIDRSTQADDAVQVLTSVYRPNYPMQRVVWVVGTVRGAAKIVDIVAAGISMRIMQRDNCVKLLTRDANGIRPLLDTLQRQAG
jgi:phospholipid transport system substrate-binding protein